MYILVHTPYLRPHHNWAKMLPEYRQVILDKLKRTAGCHDIEERIVFESALTPQDIHDRYKVLNGAIRQEIVNAIDYAGRIGIRGEDPEPTRLNARMLALICLPISMPRAEAERLAFSKRP